MSDHDAIAKRAYELYLERGSVPGYEMEDWLAAEAELVAAAANAAAAASALQSEERDEGAAGRAAPATSDGKRGSGRRETTGGTRRALRP